MLLYTLAARSHPWRLYHRRPIKDNKSPYELCKPTEHLVIQPQDSNQNQDIQITHNWSPPIWFLGLEGEKYHHTKTRHLPSKMPPQNQLIQVVCLKQFLFCFVQQTHDLTQHGFHFFFRQVPCIAEVMSISLDQQPVS